jgi:hypothetical protein
MPAVSATTPDPAIDQKAGREMAISFTGVSDDLVRKRSVNPHRLERLWISSRRYSLVAVG